MTHKLVAASAAALCLALPSGASAGFVEPATVLWSHSGEPGGYFGWAVAELGDVDGDGVQEAIVAEPFAHGTEGTTWVFSGRTGAQLYELRGQENDNQGAAVANAGDTDGDGVDDIISGASGYTGTEPGRAYLYSGATGALLHVWNGRRGGDALGYAVSAAGDVDRDGRGDVLVGAPFNDAGGQNAGRAYIYSGRTYELLRKLSTNHRGDQFGSAADLSPDVTGDGRPDFIVGAVGAKRAYVIASSSGRPVLTLHGSPGALKFGNFFTAAVGDLNGDGVSDFYAADYGATDNGPASGFAGTYSGSDGSLLHGWFGDNPGDGMGPGREAGDVDGDGVNDLAVGSYQYGTDDAGRITIFSGATGETLRTLTSTTPNENLGFDALGLGDVNGDGRPDLLAAAAEGDTVYMVGG
jgi:FG-GAP repeat protein/VCBS repeat protein